ncbi:hypothetical protein HYALB_00010556 [Hymenoscyphus albidus]|uniref:Uncharacterized protein n=1 Tax=Hymenoscyphus albidus TaxID=595503 RepID=A0A9N9PU98_9HELO|nr:hypothetical protein HYALB_00010556 [Hymenoscyphus albidus]
MSLGATRRRRPSQEKPQQDSLPNNAAVDEMTWFQCLLLRSCPVGEASRALQWGRSRGRGHCIGGTGVCRSAVETEGETAGTTGGKTSGWP